MSTKQSYLVVYGNTDEDFEANIEGFLASGWKLQGGVSLNHEQVAQALYKESEIV